jgi:uncharacterized protein YbjT (DUF2867 family)
MKVFVNSGNIGTSVALELAKAGMHVTLGVRTPKSDLELARLDVRQVPFMMGDMGAMASVLRGHDSFFSVTPLVENLAEAGCVAVRAAKAAGIRKIVRSSGLGAGPNARTKVARMQHAVEKAIEQSGIPFTILRPSNFMQNFLSAETSESIKTEGAFYSPLGDAGVSYIDVRDIAAVAAKVLIEPGHESRSYNLTGGESLTSAEIAELFSMALCRPITHIPISEEQAADAMAKAEAPLWLVELLAELNSNAKAGHLAEVKPDVKLILKRDPIRFSRFLADNIDAFIEEHVPGNRRF